MPQEHRGSYNFILLTLFGAILCILGGYGYSGYLNYHGYCHEEGRVLSEEELITLALEDQLVKRAFRAAKHNLDIAEAIQTAHPECCSFVENFPGNKLPLGDGARMKGIFRGFVRIELAGTTPEGQDFKIGPTHILLTNCGKWHPGI